MMPIANTVATWTVLAIWFLGAACALFVLVNAASNQAWRAYKNAHGWITVRKAMRQFHAGCPAVTEGYALVPVELTEKMLDAVHETAYLTKDAPWKYAERARWSTLLESAATP